MVMMDFSREVGGKSGASRKRVAALKKTLDSDNVKLNQKTEKPIQAF